MRYNPDTGYVERRTTGTRSHNKTLGTGHRKSATEEAKNWRDWWLLKSDSSNTGYMSCGKKICFRKAMAGKRVRLKVEVIEDGN